ncbi:MAG: DUF1801 domain-containing protein [Flavobacteriaceae bacterium]
MNPKVDAYLNNLNHWQNELTKLRDIILDCGLTEAYKWMHPCYMYNQKNILIIHEFKDYCGMTFFKGVLLKDTQNILIQQTENIQSARQIRFTSLSEIETLHFSKPKQVKTRLSRIEKNMERIFKGKGLTDCICGLSKRKPNCDGSHKQLETKH